MTNKSIQLAFFAVLTASVSVLLFFIFKPYLGVIFIAGTFAVVFYPLFEKLVVKFAGRRNLAALVSTFLILIFIIVPIAILLTFLLKETVGLYNDLVFGQTSKNFLVQAENLISKLNPWLGNIETQIDLESYVRGVLNWIISHFGSAFGSAFGLVFGGFFKFILMLIAVYYFLLSGEKIREILVRSSPLPNEYDGKFIDTIKSSIDAVLKGRMLVALAQGVLIGTGFAIFGIGAPVLWGFVGAIASLVPLLGTSLVTVPAVAYLFLSENYGAGIGLLIWSLLLIGLIDNFISVIFIKSKIRMHSLVILFAILGGVEFFGTIGLLAGPVAVSAFLALAKIYPFFASNKEQSS